MCVAFLVFIILLCGCGDSRLERKYHYATPKVPADIPHFVAAQPRVRGLEPSESGEKRIDLHDRYLTAHQRGFCDAAREWENSRQFMYKSFQDLDEIDATEVEKRGYWEGYTLFKKALPKN